jgi:RNA 2',3'-cyclic 3'-phosphodiesterase
MRLFLALDIPDAIRDRISLFIEGVTGFAADARWANPESLHVTLKFIGEQPDSAVDQIKQSVSQIHADATEIHFRNYGFFPTAKSPRVFWIGVESGPELATLAAAIDHALSSLGIPKEPRPFSPHLTLARAAGAAGSPRRTKTDAPNRIFHHLQEKLAARPTLEFGTMTPREFFLYLSQLSPKGSKYTKLAAFDLK